MWGLEAFIGVRECVIRKSRQRGLYFCSGKVLGKAWGNFIRTNDRVIRRSGGVIRKSGGFIRRSVVFMAR